jgi:polysaccharide export outer membrane protein
MRQSLLLLSISLLVSLPGGASAQASTTSEELRLFPGDMIQVAIWREPDLSGEFQVDEDGWVVFPLLGKRNVTDRPWRQVEEDLLLSYGRELRNPSIQITPLRRIFVLGEVTQPGIYGVEPTLTLAGALALAGGANPRGDLRKIEVMRDGETILDGVPHTAVLSSLDIRSEDQIYVERRGWFDRNSTFLVSAVLSVTSIVVTLVAR